MPDQQVKDAQSAFVEIVWWMERTNTQWRFSGDMTPQDP